MSEQENAQFMQGAYDKFNAGDIDGLLSMMADNVEWVLPDMSNVPFAGARSGHASVAALSLSGCEKVLQGPVSPSAVTGVTGFTGVTAGTGQLNDDDQGEQGDDNNEGDNDNQFNDDDQGEQDPPGGPSLEGCQSECEDQGDQDPARQ